MSCIMYHHQASVLILFIATFCPPPFFFGQGLIFAGKRDVGAKVFLHECWGQVVGRCQNLKVFEGLRRCTQLNGFHDCSNVCNANTGLITPPLEGRGVPSGEFS